MRADRERRAASRDRWTEALTWYTRLRGSDSAELTFGLWREWRDWHGDPANRQVFDRLSRLLADRAQYRHRQRPEKAALEDDQYDLSVPIAAWRRARSLNPMQRRRRSGGRWRWLLGGLGIAAVAALVALRPAILIRGRGQGAARIYQTSVGGMKEVHLRDGSSITLSARTAVSVAFSPRRRTARLISGEAWFKVAHDPNWPFVVAAGEGTITAVGTAFLVTRDSDRVVVTVTDGTVEVAARPPPWPPLRLVRLAMRSVPAPIPVSRGEELAFGDNGALRAIKPADTRAATAWTDGRLTFDDQPLRYVVETINRYSSRRIVVGPSAGALRFSGIVFDNDIEDWLKSLEVIFPVTETARGSDVYIQLRRPTLSAR